MNLMEHYIDYTPDKTQPDEFFEQLKTRLEYLKPKTKAEIARCFHVSENTVDHWIKNPYMKVKGKFFKRKEIYLNYVQPLVTLVKLGL